MKWKTVKLKEWNGYKLKGDTAYAKGKKLYLNRLPSNKTIERLKQFGIKEIVWENGDFYEI